MRKKGDFGKMRRYEAGTGIKYGTGMNERCSGKMNFVNRKQIPGQEKTGKVNSLNSIESGLGEKLIRMISEKRRAGVIYRIRIDKRVIFSEMKLKQKKSQ